MLLKMKLEMQYFRTNAILIFLSLPLTIFHVVKVKADAVLR